jgi:AraC-like DNA-binding protein
MTSPFNTESAQVSLSAPFALSQTSYGNPPDAVLVAWGTRALYRGPVFGLPAHRSAVTVLALCLQGEMGLSLRPRSPSGGFVSCTSALIDPGTLHELRPGPGAHAFVYADALSADLLRWRRRCRRRVAPGLGIDLEEQGILIDALRRMPASAEGWRAARSALQHTLGMGLARADDRVLHAVEQLRHGSPEAQGTTAQARALGLSASRFQHLFKAATGVPYRRFRLWLRLHAVLRQGLQGASLTRAALDAGFASSAHFSATFKTQFGMAASNLLALQPVWIDDAGTPDAQPLVVMPHRPLAP